MLTYQERGTRGAQFDVISGEVRIATLWKHITARAGGVEDWRWTFTMSAGPPGFEVQGRADSKTSAQYELERTWLRWVHAAGLGDQAQFSTVLIDQK